MLKWVIENKKRLLIVCYEILGELIENILFYLGIGGWWFVQNSMLRMLDVVKRVGTILWDVFKK